MAHVDDVEGEDQRSAVRKACEGMKISVTAIRKRELDEQVKTAFGNAASRVQRRISRREVLSAHLGPRITRLRTCRFHDSGARGDCCFSPCRSEELDYRPLTASVASRVALSQFPRLLPLPDKPR